MSRYPEGDALLAVCRAGLGKLVIVEGETDYDDPYFYGRWFGDLARELTFIPQNGHEKVLKAVQDLRTRLSPAREVYGIRDRDFSDDSAWQAQANAIPTDGVLFTRWYTLENYLLVPDGWFKAVARTVGPNARRTALARRVLRGAPRMAERGLTGGVAVLGHRQGGAQGVARAHPGGFGPATRRAHARELLHEPVPGAVGRARDAR